MLLIVTQIDMGIVEFRSDNLSDQCNHVVQRAIVLTKKGLSYKQMLNTRRVEIRKAEAEVFLF
jgi:hypothetical protein